MINIRLIIIFIFLLAAPLFNPHPLQADKVDRLYKKAAKSYHLLYKKGSFRKKAHNWLKTIKKFQYIHRKYPRHRRAHQSLFNEGRLYSSLFRWNKKSVYLDRGNLAFRKLVRKYRRSSLADDAQFLLARNYEVHKKNKNLAFIEYSKLTELFPRGDYNKKARRKIKELRPYLKRRPARRKPTRRKPTRTVKRAPGKDFKTAPRIKKAVTPALLTKPRHGGLSHKANRRKNRLSLVSKVDYWSTADWSRMVINVKEEVRYKYQLLKADRRHPQKRMYIDILKSYLPKKFKRKIAVNDGLISQARVAQFNKNTVRIVLDMASIKKIAIFHFKEAKKYKIVIDILGKSKINEAFAAAPKYSGKKGSEGAISLSKAFGLKVKKIVIDPGHGGRDPGAVYRGVKEKDIALKVSFMLKRIINKKRPDIKVLMTRATDRYIKLEARTAFANKNKADLFISVHVNAARRPNLRGVETYYLNLTSDNEALSLAAKENQLSMKSLSDLQSILNDLMNNSKINESRLLAERVQSSMVKSSANSRHKLVSLGVKQAPFLVLLGARMPSVLVEIGFITNRTENRHLTNKKYQRVIAKGIYGGIQNYVERL